MCFLRLLSGCGSRVDNHRRVLATLAAGLAKRKLGGGEQHRQPDDAGDHGADGGDDGAGWVRGGDYYANMGR